MYSTLYCQILKKLEFPRQIFEKYSNIKFHENPSSGSRVVPCGQMDGGRTDMTKLIVAIRNFANLPKKEAKCHFSITFRAKEKLFLKILTGRPESAARSQTYGILRFW
jgi:hypothetical protein